MNSMFLDSGGTERGGAASPSLLENILQYLHPVMQMAR